MKNVAIEMKGSKLVITVDLAKDFGPSSSGKNNIVASTEGNIPLDPNGTKLGLNVYRPANSANNRKSRKSE
jgi:hypothetical protein